MLGFFKTKILKKASNDLPSNPTLLPPPPTACATHSKLPDNFWEEFAQCPCTITTDILFHTAPHCPKYQNIKFNPTNTTIINNTDNPAPARIKSTTV